MKREFPSSSLVLSIQPLRLWNILRHPHGIFNVPFDLIHIGVYNDVILLRKMNEGSHNDMEYDTQMKNRMKRIEGQVRGILKMMDEEKDCRSVVAQLSAARTALDRTAALIVSTNLEQCIREEKKSGESSEDLIKEAVNLLVKSR